MGVRSHIGWGGERNTLYKGVETFPKKTRFKNLERKPERENPKRTISASGGPRLLQMVSEPDTGRCASEDAVSRREVDLVGVPHRLEKGTSANEDAGP